MKEKGGAGKIAAVLLLLAAVCLFAVLASGTKISFLENYSRNFKMNILALTNRFGIELSEPAKEYLQDIAPKVDVSENAVVAEPDEQQTAPSTIENTEDIPEVEFDEASFADKNVKTNPVALEDASSAKYARYRGYMLCVSPTSVIAFNADGNSLWAIGIHMSDPILSVGGNYYMIAERGGTKAALFDGKKLLYETEADGAIKTATVSSNGDITIVSDKEYYKGAVIVINKNGDRVFSWSSGSDSIVCADIAAGSRKLAVALLNTENGAKSRVQLFDITKGESTAETVFENSVVFDVDFLGEVLNVFADDKVCGVSQRGKILWEADYSERKLIHTRADSSGYKLLMVDNDNTTELEVLTGRGKQKAVIGTDSVPDCIDISSGLIAYNLGRDIVLSGLSGKQKKVCSCTREIRSVHIIDANNVMVVYNSGLEFIKFI